MSQKSSLLQPAQSVSWVLTLDSDDAAVARGKPHVRHRRGDFVEELLVGFQTLPPREKISCVTNRARRRPPALDE
jgi:hypothetical protein